MSSRARSKARRNGKEVKDRNRKKIDNSSHTEIYLRYHHKSSFKPPYVKASDIASYYDISVDDVKDILYEKNGIDKGSYGDDFEIEQSDIEGIPDFTEFQKPFTDRIVCQCIIFFAFMAYILYLHFK